MKNLRDYLTMLEQPSVVESQTTESSDMRRLKKFAQVDLAGNEGLYETTVDRWSRNAKHQLAKAELVNASDEQQFDENEVVIYEGQEVTVKIPQGPKGTAGIMFEGHLKMVHHSKLTKLDEGVMGGVQTMTPINRIMQLAGLEHTGAVAVEETELAEEQLDEDAAGNMFDQLLTKNQNDPKYKNNPDAAKIATVGQVLAGLQGVLSDIPADLPSGIANQLKAVPGIGASLITAASQMTKPTPGA
mgnify:CR=1 FL=1|jgi:hypothetical protein